MKKQFTLITLLCVICALCIAAARPTGTVIKGRTGEDGVFVYDEIPPDKLEMDDRYFKAVISDLPADKEYTQVTANNYLWIISGDEVYARYYLDPFPGWSPAPLPGCSYEDMHAEPRIPLKLSECELGVPIKSQGDHNCWAAASASIISYKTEVDPSAEEVCRKIFPFDGDHAATLDTAVRALAKYGLSATLLRDILTFPEVRRQLGNDCPVLTSGEALVEEGPQRNSMRQYYVGSEW